MMIMIMLYKENHSINSLNAFSRLFIASILGDVAATWFEEQQLRVRQHTWRPVEEDG